MTSDQQAILDLLKSSPDAFFSRKEISRKAASRELYEENPHWVVPHLNALVDLKLIEQNQSGHYRIASERRE